jgi:hypothetical protein
MLTTALLLLLPAWVHAQEDREPVVIDRVVVVVSGKVITQSDLNLSIVLDAQDPSEVPMLSGVATNPTERLINRKILLGLAGEIRVFQPTEAEVRIRMNRLKNSWTELNDYRTFMLQHGLNETRLMLRLTERIVVERYIERNLTGQGQEPTLAEYRQWMAQHRAGVRIRKVAPAKIQP